MFWEWIKTFAMVTLTYCTFAIVVGLLILFGLHLGGVE